MKQYLKMDDVFDGAVTANHGDNYNGWSVVETSQGISIDESGDGGFEAKTADYVAHAINSHDELVENMQHYKQEAAQWEARATNEASRAQDLEDEVDRLRREVVYLSDRLEKHMEKMIDRLNK